MSLKNVKIAYHLGAHCIDKWNRWQLDLSLDIKTQSNTAKINAIQSLSSRKCFYPHQLQKLTSPSSFNHGPREKVSWKVHITLCVFSPEATHILQFSEKHDSKTWSQVKERRVNRERERAAEQASISEGTSLSPRTGFPGFITVCLELRSLKKMFPLWISNEFPLNL